MRERWSATFSSLMKRWFRYRVMRQAHSVKGPLYVNGCSNVSRKTEIGKNVHFNGIRICGGGQFELEIIFTPASSA